MSVEGRASQVVLLLSMGVLSWLGMMAVHELGHVLGAWATGGQVQRVVWHPRVISRTDVDPNPRPLGVVWAGPVAGAALPAAAYGVAVAMQWAARHLLGFFAGFCLIANGAYIGVGAFTRAADAGVMLFYGSPWWAMAAFGVLAAGLGLGVWNRESPWFGFGDAPRRVGWREAGITAATMAGVAGLGCWFGDPG